MFPTKSYMFSGLTFKSLIQLEFVVRKYSNFILLHVAVQFLQLRGSFYGEGQQAVAESCNFTGLKRQKVRARGRLLVVGI